MAYRNSEAGRHSQNNTLKGETTFDYRDSAMTTHMNQPRFDNTHTKRVSNLGPIEAQNEEDDEVTVDISNANLLPTGSNKFNGRKPATVTVLSRKGSVGRPTNLDNRSTPGDHRSAISKSAASTAHPRLNK